MIRKDAHYLLWVMRVFCAEDMGFEPTQQLPALSHFECDPFDHLGNPPCALHLTLYKYPSERVFCQIECKSLVPLIAIYGIIEKCSGAGNIRDILKNEAAQRMMDNKEDTEDYA